MARLVKIAELYHENLLKLIDVLFTPVIQQLDHLRKLTESRKCSLTSNEENIIKEIFSLYNTTNTEWLLKIDDFQTDLKIIISILNPRVTWIPEAQENAIFSYYNGHSPWSLTLVAENWKIDTMAIQKEIIDIFVDGGIDEFPGNAAIGDYVFYFKDERINRGLIQIVCDESYVIINIDNGHIAFCGKNMILSPACDTELNPAQSLHCSIVNSAEYDESLWCPELENIFRTFLEENKFRLAKWSKDSSVPPKFTVRLIAINYLNEEVDLTQWLEEEILKPWKLEGLPSGKSAIQFFGPRIKHPFVSRTTKLSHEKPLNQILNPTSTSAVETNFENQLAINCEPEINYDEFIARLQGVKEENIQSSPNSSITSEEVPVLVPIEGIKVPTSPEEQDQPEDDHFCSKTNCNSLQQKPADDKTKVYRTSFNSVELPACGEVTIIKVLETVDGCTFFGALPTSFFSMNGRSVTLTQEMRRINDFFETKSYKRLTAIPTVGEIVLAYCADKQFYRAKIMEVTKDGCSVFLVDFGKNENVSFEDLKKIEERFLHYPFQAIQFRLGGITCKNEKKAKEIMKDIEGQCFRAVLLPSLQEECLKVKIFVGGDNNKTLNEFMVQLGGCNLQH